jgi:hypothetical protein
MRESIVKFRSPGRVYMVRVSPWRATRRHLPVPCGNFGAGLVPNTFNPNTGFPKLVYLVPDIDERVVVYLPSWPITGPRSNDSLYLWPAILCWRAGERQGSTIAVHYHSVLFIKKKIFNFFILVENLMRYQKDALYI